MLVCEGRVSGLNQVGDSPRRAFLYVDDPDRHEQYRL